MIRISDVATLAAVSATMALCSYGLAAAKHATPSAARLDPPQSTPDPSKLNFPGPEAQNLMLGTWSIRASAPNGDELGNGSGIELWSAGPAGNSVIEELHWQRDDGKQIEGFGAAWWDEAKKGQRFLWCDSTDPEGCSVSKEIAKWDGDRLVYTEDDEVRGQKLTRQEIFFNLTPNSFAQSISVAPAGEKPRRVWQADATKMTEDKPRLLFATTQVPYAPKAQPNEAISSLGNRIAGTWSIELNLAPAANMPKGGGGAGQEIWRVGPGGYSVIEDYRSTGTEGNLAGLAVFWWNRAAQRIQVLWCDESNPGCRVLPGAATWEGNRFVLFSEGETDGKKNTSRETFYFDKPNTFTQLLEIGDSRANLKRVLTIHAHREGK